jgi:MFS transporter, DHA1 family, solute carrier family 18 (vesicular amine transporter), member 1/2
MASRASRTFVLALVTYATFTDIVAYAIAVPVLPDLSRRLGASPTTIGLLFSSFGVTLLCVSIPMGAVSDRVGRRRPLAGGLVALSAATLLFACAGGLPLLFTARLVQGAADAVTWVVGLALLADVYGPAERGRATGIVMSGAGCGFMIGPSLGGWLYEMGGMRLPFIAVAVMAAVGAIACAWLDVPSRHARDERVPVLAVVRAPAVAACAAAVVAGAATISMLEPVVALQFALLRINPGRIGIVFGVAAAGSTMLHPVYGRLADRWGPRRLTLWGLVLTAAMLPLLGRVWSFESAVGLYLAEAAAMALMITPSLAYMADATSGAGIGSFGVTYGVYNVAWGVGLIGGPAAGGFLLERLGFARLALWWAPPLIVTALLLGRIKAAAPSPRAA